MEQLFLPVLSHFQNRNTWTASVGALRYRAVPGEDGLTGEVWQGPWCYELSRVEDSALFPLSDEGIDQLRAWVMGWAETMAGRPEETLAETLARRDAAAEQAQGEG